MKKDIIVIGASTGGFQALQQLVAGLSPDLNAAIFIVWHLAPDSLNVLPGILNEQNSLKASTATDRQPILFNHIYTAPPDKHLVLTDGIIRVTNGPKENRFRPAVDPLFRSAALAYGSRVIGIILSGGLDDGTAGLWTIKQYGGTAVVQHPNDAEVASMPLSALRNVEVDYMVPMAAMSGLLGRLVAEDAQEMQEPMPAHERTRKEVGIALQDQLQTHIEGFDGWTPITCPDCNGVLSAIHEGDRIRYRCHTGHAFSSDSLLDAISSNIENSLWGSIRFIKESISVLNHMGDHFAESNRSGSAALFFKKAKEAETRLNLVWQAVMDNEHLSTIDLTEQGCH